MSAIFRRRAAAAAFLLGSAALLATPATASAQATPAPMNVTPFAGLFHPIASAAHPGMCLTAADTDWGAKIFEDPCDGSAAQEWAILTTPSGGTHYRFLNTGGFCLWTPDDPVVGELPHLDECQTSAAADSTVSNAEWNASLPLPNAVTLQTRVGFVNWNLCLNEVIPGGPGLSSSFVSLAACNGGASQVWVVGFGG
jgi:hypothetical protein